MLLRLVERLQNQSIENIVVSLSKRETLASSFEAMGVPVAALGMGRKLSDARLVRDLGQVLERAKPQIIQTWMYHANLAVSCLQPFLGRRVPVIWNVRRGMDDYQERKLATRLVIRANRVLSRLPNRIVYCTNESRVQHESYGFNQSKSLVIGNGFDTSKYVPNAERRRLVRASFGIKDNEIVIGNVGRDDPSKGRAFLLAAMSQVVRRFPQARLLLVGRGMVAHNTDLQREIERHQLAANVTLVGEYAPSTDLYPAMDLLCLASTSEGFPNVVAEGMSCALPCVVTDVGNSRELLDGIGVIVPARDAQSLAFGLGKLCSEPEQVRQARGKRARERIVARYSMVYCADAYAALYSHLLG